MTETRPLRVDVAEAVGWTQIQVMNGRYFGFAPGTESILCIPEYPTSWCSTGPLIDRYQILLGPEFTPDAAHVFAGEWSAMLAKERIDATIVRGRTALEAVCNLIVQVKKEGKI